jgi:hypothetical protein
MPPSPYVQPPPPGPGTRLALALSWLITLFSQNIGGGPRPLKLQWVVTAQKGGTLLWLTALMLYYDNFSVPALIYTAMHGSYGLAWCVHALLAPAVGAGTHAPCPAC